MREDIAGPQGASSRPMWEMLEGMVREKAQEFHPTDHGGGSHGVVRPGEVRAQEYGGLGRGLAQRIGLSSSVRSALAVELVVMSWLSRGFCRRLAFS